MKALLEDIVAGQRLTEEEAFELMDQVALGRLTTAQHIVLLTAIQMRTVTVEEISGFRRALYEHARSVDLQGVNAIDLCGTGGDGKDTFNISTLASFVVAGAGYPVAKHGNYGVSSVCGSSNVLEALGYKFTNEEDALRTQLERAGICFLHAPQFHPAMRHVVDARRGMGMKTVFNLLGPLVNPARPAFKYTGVYSLEVARLYNYVLESDNAQYTIVHSADGYDEVSLTGQCHLYSDQGKELLEAETMGLSACQETDLVGGGSIEAAVCIFTNVLEGRGTSVQRQVTLANAGLAIHTINPEKELSSCIEEATESLDNGRALASLKKLIS